MVGKRKLTGFIITAVLLSLAGGVAIFKGADPLEVFKLFSVAKMVNAGGFFSFNGLEHWSKKNKDKQG